MVGAGAVVPSAAMYSSTSFLRLALSKSPVESLVAVSGSLCSRWKRAIAARTSLVTASAGARFRYVSPPHGSACSMCCTSRVPHFFELGSPSNDFIQASASFFRYAATATARSPESPRLCCEVPTASVWPSTRSDRLGSSWASLAMSRNTCSEAGSGNALSASKWAASKTVFFEGVASGGLGGSSLGGSSAVPVPPPSSAEGVPPPVPSVAPPPGSSAGGVPPPSEGGALVPPPLGAVPSPPDPSPPVSSPGAVVGSPSSEPPPSPEPSPLPSEVGSEGSVVPPSPSPEPSAGLTPPTRRWTG